jgi:uncharacterized protein
MGMEWFNDMDTDGETPMSRAMKCGHSALASFMSRQEIDDRPENAAGDTLVQRAAYWGLEQAMTKLLSGGATTHERDVRGETPLHKAVRRGHTDTVCLLLQGGADTDSPDEFGMTSLHWTAVNGRADVARLLLDSGASPNVREYASGGLTPLAMSNLMGYDDLTELLSSRGGTY